MKQKAIKLLQRYGSDIMNSPEFRAGYKQIHHHHSTVAEHSIYVAFFCVMIALTLKKFNISTKISMLVETALCHDLGIIGRDDKYDNNHECYKQHPMDSTEIARVLMTEYDDKTEEAISRHMWPLFKPLKTPTSLEGAIITVADKVAACTGH